MYSQNRLKNPSAENGTAEWITKDATVVEGGIDGKYCFELSGKAYIEQKQNIAGQPPDCKITAFFLPGQDVTGDKVNAQIEVIYEYADNTIEKYVFPLF